MIHFKSVTPIGAFAFGFDVPKLRLGYSGLVILQGENGSGKSSIMNSVVQALFGNNDTPGDGDEIANSVLKEGCGIIVEFEASGKSYTAEYARRFKREGSNARVTDLFLFDEDGTDLRKESSAATFAEIRKILNLDYEQFRATSYLGVQTAPKFLNGTDQERMQVVTPFLGLGLWDNAQKQVRILSKSTLDALAQSKGSYEQLERILEDARNSVLVPEKKKDLEDDLEINKSKIAGLKSELERVIASSNSVESRLLVLEADGTRLDNDLRGYKKLLDSLGRDRTIDLSTINASYPAQDRTELERQICARNDIVSDFRDKRTVLEQERKATTKLLLGLGISPEVDELLNLVRTTEGERANKKASTVSLEASIDRIPDDGVGECPTCYSQVDVEHLASVREQLIGYLKADQNSILMLAQLIADTHKYALCKFDEFKTAKLAQINKQLSDLDASESSALETLDSAIAIEESILKELVFEWRKSRIEELEVTYGQRVGKTQDAIEETKTNLNRVLVEFEKLKLDPTRLKNLDQRNSLKNHILGVEESVRKSERLLSDSALFEKQVSDTRCELERVRADIGALEMRVDDLAFLDSHLGDKGIKRYKLSDRLGFMNEKLAKYMEIMSLPIQVWFQDRVVKKSAQKKKPELLTDDDYSDKFEIFVQDGVKSGVPVGLYSGGERTLISLAILGVLWETANTFGCGGSNLLMIDEPFGLLREENRDRALALLEYWGSLGKCVVVSDNTDAVSQIGRRAATWTCVKYNHVSNIEVREG